MAQRIKKSGKYMKSDFSNTLILVPVYNCEKHLDELFTCINKVSKDIHVLCINDGSNDNSLNIIKRNRISYIDLGSNRGKGYALKVGFLHAKRKGYKYIITLDGDMQHDPLYIPNFIQAQNLFEANLVIGFRDFSFKNMPFSRVLSNYITSSIVSYKSDIKVLDSQSGYRLYDLDFFNVKEIKTTRYQMETEILLNYIKKGAKIFHTEIPVIYKDEKSNISHFRDITNFVKVILSPL